MISVRTILASLLSVVLLSSGIPQTDPIEHTWANQDNTAHIQIYKGTDGKFYGKLVWLSEPLDEKTGKPKLDLYNPDEKLRNRPLIQLVMIQGYSKSTSDPKVYAGGSIYDPKSGKTYCGKMTLDGKQMKLKGFICGVRMLGRSETWTIVK
jgi:uncharacterized protein (DUF2147 family)